MTFSDIGDGPIYTNDCSDNIAEFMLAVEFYHLERKYGVTMDHSGSRLMVQFLYKMTRNLNVSPIDIIKYLDGISNIPITHP